MEPIPIRKPRRRWWVKGLIALALVFLLYEGVQLASNIRMVWRLHYAVRESRANGQPLTFTEIDAQRPPGPPGETAAQIFLTLRPRLQALAGDKALDALPEMKKDRDTPIGCRWSEPVHAKVNAVLQRMGPELAILKTLKDYPAGDLPLAIQSDPLDTGLEELKDVGLARKLLALSAFQNAMDGQTQRAADDLSALSRLAGMLKTYPTLMGSTHCVSIQAWLTGTTEQTCGLTVFTSQQLLDLDALLERLDAEDPMWWGMLGDRAMLYEKVTLMLQSAPSSLMNPGGMLGAAWRVRRDLALGLRFWNRVLSAGHDLPQRAKMNGLGFPEVREDDAFYRDYPLTTTFTPGLGRAVELDRRARALLRATRVGLAAERYRLERGEFPGRAKDLVPAYLKALPLDPFDDQPMRYTATSDGVMTYSDRVDDDKYKDGVKPPDVPPMLRFELKIPAVRGKTECPTSSAPAIRELGPALDPPSSPQ